MQSPAPPPDPPSASVSTELEALAADRPHQTCEKFTPNDFYGIATILKRYCGLPPDFVLPGIVPHGPYLHTNVWDKELADPSPNLFLSAEIQRAVYAQKCSKACHLIGFPYYYAVRLLDDEAGELRRRAAGAVVFPAHSTHHITSQFSQEEFIEQLRLLPAEFQPVRVCLYWRDIVLGRHKPYLEAGFACTTAGHMYDPQFLLRLVRILHAHRFAVGNELGTSLLCAATSGLGVRILRHEVTYQGDSTFTGLMGTGHELEICRRFQEACQQLVPKTDAQRPIADEALGRAFVREPAELRELFESLAAQLPVTNLKSWLARRKLRSRRKT
jgi:hypothetical protein